MTDSVGGATDTMNTTTEQLTFKFCACGCGQPVPIARFPSDQCKYISGHQPNASRPLIERFWEKVDKRGPDECWEWQAGKIKVGYGVIGASRSNQILLAHRLSWEIHNGIIPDDLYCLHKCDNRSCVNPNHLFLGTHQDNMEDMIAKKRNAKGARLPQTKLNREQVIMIRKLCRQGLSQSQVARRFSVTQSAVWGIVNYKTWKHIP